MNLHPYQQAMVSHQLLVPRGCTFAPMGSGKTLATMTTIDTLITINDLPGPVLVLAPRRVAETTWPDEARKWSDLLTNIEVSAVVGSAAERKAALKRGASIYTMNYENLPWLVEHLDGKWPFSMVIPDESTRLKSFRLKQGGVRARALSGVSARSHRWSNLTGTPAPNGLADLWGQLWFCDKGARLGRSYTDFMNRWFKVQFQRTPEILPYAQQEIEALIADICLSVDIRPYIDVREPVVRDLFVNLPAAARGPYKTMERKFFMDLEGKKINAANAAVKSMKLLQICNGAVYTDEDATEWVELHDAKLQALESVLVEACGAPVLVAYHFQSDLERLQRAFPHGRHLDDKPQTVRDWNAGKLPLMFAHPASAGHGLNLQDGGNILVYFGLWWNLEDHDQIGERIGPLRQAQAGYDRWVFVYRIVARDTIDEIVLNRLTSKRSVQDCLVEAMKREA
jgi:SNF2 family DNA or RNA helicase